VGQQKSIPSALSRITAPERRRNCLLVIRICDEVPQESSRAYRIEIEARRIGINSPDIHRPRQRSPRPRLVHLDLRYAFATPEHRPAPVTHHIAATMSRRTSPQMPSTLVAIALLLLASLQTVSAHFQMVYPAWRGNSLVDDKQWEYPCLFLFRLHIHSH